MRVDAGVVEGSAVSIHYDPMISKLVTFGDTREDALERVKTALDGEGKSCPCMFKCLSFRTVGAIAFLC